MKSSRYRLILGFALFVSACTKATPDFTVLDTNRVPRPTFAGAFTKNLQTFSDSLTFQINGECDPRIRAIVGSAVGSVSASAWSAQSVSVGGITASCQTDGKFQFELKSLSALGFTPSEGAVYEIQLRAETAGGASNPSSIRVLYTQGSGGIRPVVITSGGTGGQLVAGGTLTASVRIGNKLNRQPGSAQTSAEDAFLKSGPPGSTLQSTMGPRLSQ